MMQRLFTKKFDIKSTMKKTSGVLIFFTVVLYLVVQQILVIQYEEETKAYNKILINLVSEDLKYSEIMRKPDKLPKATKYLLLWTRDDYDPFYRFGKGQWGFVEMNCPAYNCYVTSDRNLFGESVTKFDAIGFNAKNMQSKMSLPHKRSPNQLYIFFSVESSERFVVCLDVYDGFFNQTVTFKLDSDIVWNYFDVFNSQGQVVAPRIDAKWDKEYKNVDQSFDEMFKKKTKLAAWFVSNCKTARSKRMEYVKELQQYLQLNGTKVDIYGWCGELKCDWNNEAYCNKKLEDDYFFYLAFENSMTEDYITEKVQRALQNNVVPIVFGLANYSRFIPPGSYIDALAHTPRDLAVLMNITASSVKLYSQYFRWKSHYSVKKAKPRVCEVCALLNNKTVIEKKKVYKDFRRWWHPQFERRCADEPGFLGSIFS